MLLAGRSLWPLEVLGLWSSTEYFERAPGFFRALFTLGEGRLLWERWPQVQRLLQGDHLPSPFRTENPWRVMG